MDTEHEAETGVELSSKDAETLVEEEELIVSEVVDGTSEIYFAENRERDSNMATSSDMIMDGNLVQPERYVEMEGMHIVINEITDIPEGQIITETVEYDGEKKHFVERKDESGVLLTLTDEEGRVILTEESLSMESSNVNIRADERLPPRGELSGQESMGGTNDSWSRLHYEGSSSYNDALSENWDDSSDVEVPPPLQSRILPVYEMEHAALEPVLQKSISQTTESEYQTLETMDNSGMFVFDVDHQVDSDPPATYEMDPPAAEPLASKMYKCQICSEKFPNLRTRRQHEADVHRKQNKIGTEIGRKKTKRLVIKAKAPPGENLDFKNKLKVEEIDIKPETVVKDETDIKALCTLCDQVLENAKALREHKQTVHNITSSQLRHRCATCGESFPNDYKFSAHLQIHPLECKMCGRLFYRRANIQLHMRRHLGIKPHKCDVCGKSFITRQKLHEHRNIHTGEAPIKCNQCDETFRRHSNLVQHRNRHHLHLKRKLKDYICSWCNEVFHSKKKLAWHLEIHEAKPKACTYCKEKFIHTASLTRHMRKAHNKSFLPEESTAKNVECPICKGIYCKGSLEVHLRNHNGQRPYTCLICNKDFTTKWNLKLHKYTHAPRLVKPFKCELCKGAFIREAEYTAHMNSHKSIRPYTCNYCGAKFIRKYNCQRHVKEHETDKMFTCNVCSKTFHRSYYLNDHMRIHSGVRPYSCNICGKTSTTKSNHNKHVQIHHAREPVSTEN